MASPRTLDQNSTLYQERQPIPQNPGPEQYTTSGTAAHPPEPWTRTVHYIRNGSPSPRTLDQNSTLHQERQPIPQNPGPEQYTTSGTAAHPPEPWTRTVHYIRNGSPSPWTRTVHYIRNGSPSPRTLDQNSTLHQERQPRTLDQNSTLHQERQPIPLDQNSTLHQERQPIPLDQNSTLHQERQPIPLDQN
ncbi:putative uncharacterized protein FLJ45999, partial [Salvelinus fontinalis]|uniref:putative uncharacterized protein FLJ45999 n=1 Tax=Salvelinus fontinalis TaxID=8038 RepID=UPI0024853DD5